MTDIKAKILQFGGKMKQDKVSTTCYNKTKQQKKEYCEKNNINISDADWWQLMQTTAFEYLKIKGAK